jgi:hypothetical protein
MPAVTTYSLTGDAYVDGVLGDRKWAVTSLSYSFPASGSYYGTSYGEGENVTSFGALIASQQTTVRAALRMYSAVANLTFGEISETASQHADLRFALSNVPGTAWAYFPSTSAEGGDAWFNRTDYSNPVKGNYAYLTFLHEIGHALGLEHAHEHNIMPLDRDSMEYTVMSYRSYVGASTTSGYVNETWGYAQSLMVYDIAALQHLYGANYATNSGNTMYSWSPTTGEMSINGVGQGAPGGNRILQSIWDGGGRDTYDFSDYATNLTIDLRPGAWTTTYSTQLAKLSWDGSKIAAGNIANALLYQGNASSLIENAVGGLGNDFLTGNQANNALSGGAGSDTLQGGIGNDWLDGGSGSDVVLYAGLRRESMIGGSLQERSVISAAEGTDALTSVEVLQFGDGRLVYDVLDRAAVVYRMYDSAFNRAPDVFGFNDWIAALERGTSVNDIAAFFAASAEFQATYNSVSNQGFVEQLYRNVLGREGEAAGVANWTSALNTGTFSRGQVLVGFSESAEHIALLRPAVEAGLWDQNENATAVARLYHATLDRAPDAAGLTDWTKTLEGGQALQNVADGFVFSREFQGKYGSLSNQQFVEQLYLNVLDRNSDTQGLANWTNMLDSGQLDRSDVVVGFSESTEFKLKTQPLFDGGILFA